MFYEGIMPKTSLIEDVNLPFCAHLINSFLFLKGVEHRHVYLSEMR